MSSKYSGNSLFDDIFQLQSTIPENDIDPEDPEDGFKSGLTEGATDEVEELGSTQLKKRTTVILDDPKYRGKRTSRKDLYSDEEDDEFSKDGDDISSFAIEYASEEDEDESGDDSDDDDEGDDEDDPNDDSDDDADESEILSPQPKKVDIVVRAPTESSDRGKGKAVAHQLGMWDDLMRCRISLQKIMSVCNRLPLPEDWEKFASFPEFQTEAQVAQGSMRKVMTALMELQQQMDDKLPAEVGKGKLQGSDDEEITSESDPEDDETELKKAPKAKGGVDVDKDDDDEDDDDGEMEDENGEDGRQEDDMDFDEGAEDEESKLDKQKEFEELLTKGHKKFTTFRNNALMKWDEKTRLTSAYVKSKNFAAFDISVLKQIQQVLGNKVRLIRRIHQNRSNARILGQASSSDNTVQELVLEDDEDEVGVRGRPRRQEVDVNFDIIDDSDFYQMCLKDFIQLKQSDEDTNPELLNKHMIEIQNLRKKQKRKVDTRATKGKKIRYHVKEQLRNFMAPYDKSTWSDQQKDDLFKAVFGGQQGTEMNAGSKKKEQAFSINIGL